MNAYSRLKPPPLDPRKFRDPARTARGEPRAAVALEQLATLWFNTGTLCNLTCRHCYIGSSPTNDALAYLSADEVGRYLAEIKALNLDTAEIGFTGGEPFMNPDIIAMLERALSAGFRVLVLTNAMRPLWRHKRALSALRECFADRLVLRVSLDHYTPAVHEAERGPRTWKRALDGLKWLLDNGFSVRVAGRNFMGESEDDLRAGYRRLFAEQGIGLSADPAALTLFPEMDMAADVPEITDACWGILGLKPQAVMCARARMVIKHRGAAAPVVAACTLIADDPGFELGPHLADALGAVRLNHPHCARFCVLGGGQCSSA